FDLDVVNELIDRIEHGNYKKGEIPPLWDGNATARILRAIAQLSGKTETADPAADIDREHLVGEEAV
ncbi:MAG: hypothetical protein R3281_04070, partial [Balneolaceae bacterium]|nr:hypothetical protein [Balneolaceae bacterium]